MLFYYISNYNVFKAFTFILIVISVNKLQNFYINISNLNFKFILKCSQLINNSPYMKNKSDSSIKKLAIVLPVDSKINKKKSIYNTINHILNLNYKYYSLLIIYNNKRPKFNENNIIFIEASFNSIFAAYNIILDTIKNYDYISFLTPGDLITPSVFNFLDIIEEHDIYQIYGFIKSFYNIDEEQNYIKTIKHYDLLNKLPDNTHIICDKIYKISFLKEYNLKFIIHEKSLYYFNLLAFSYSNDLLYIFSFGIKHDAKSFSAKIYNNKYQEAYIFNKIISVNKSVTVNIIQNMNKIDYVFPYVTINDINWKNLYKTFFSLNNSQFESGIQRFRDNGLLKYLFRSLEKFLPWINKVHMIVMCDSQVPNWVNRDKVNIIYHSDFIPKQYLPAFSSSLIEVFLPFLPFVQEKFIYGNDDLIPCRPLSKNLFFRGNIPCYNINIRDYMETAPGDNLRRNAFNLITGKKQKKRVITTQHSTISYKLSLIKNCYNKYKNSILNSISKFREEKNYNQYIYSFYQMMEDTIFNMPQKLGIFSVKPNIVENILSKNFSRYDFVCLNDDIEMKDKDWKKIIEKFEELLPKKSKYEK